jgi:hypothetical protein
MGKVSCFKLEGIECWFNSQEHRPAHFHAKRKGQWHIRVYFQQPKDKMIQRVRDRRLRSRISKADRNSIVDVAELYREELLVEWEQKACCDE